jgi:hypothetical protein
MLHEFMAPIYVIALENKSYRFNRKFGQFLDNLYKRLIPPLNKKK